MAEISSLVSRRVKPGGSPYLPPYR